MGKPLTIQEADDERLEALKANLGAKTKVEVLRKALDSLEMELKRRAKTNRLMRAARMISRESARVNKAFQPHSLLKRS